ncbi:hypothetical protein Tco_0680583 [Tanacetum coccineum]|uniref:Uncharacterized protein n=1 Tax=Tanacetum coccineum TaxID=301880 RepID=A0ABQ4XKX2_9ASTR
MKSPLAWMSRIQVQTHLQKLYVGFNLQSFLKLVGLGDCVEFGSGKLSMTLLLRDVKICSFGDAIHQTYVNPKVMSYCRAVNDVLLESETKEDNYTEFMFHNERPKVDKLLLKKNPIGSEVRAECMADAENNLQFLNEYEIQRR